jgi:hypothetical protein
MKLELARTIFVLGALAVASVAVAAWEEPGTKILSASQGEGQCLLPRVARIEPDLKPDHDLLLLMFGLAQGSGPQR